jgi:hypothetical protein
VNEAEAKAVAAVAARCLTWSGWRRWEPVMRYGRLFTPGPEPDGSSSGMFPELAGRAAYRRAVDAGLLYAEGYAGYPRAGGVSWPWPWAWCLDGETVVDPAATLPGTAYFGVALRPEYLRRVHAARIPRAGRGDDGGEGFRWAFTRGDRETPPLDPATDLRLDLGRDIPAAVRAWALTAERHPGPPRRPPDWVLAELLGSGAPGPAGRNQFHDLWAPSPLYEVPLPAAPGPYARFQVCLAAWFDSGIVLRCGVPAGGADPGHGHIVGMVRDGDSLATLRRMADEHRPRCEEDPPRTSEPVAPPAWTPAEVRLQTAGRTFAVLRRIEYHAWHAWLRGAGGPDEAPDRRVTRNCVSYELALAAVFHALGGEMPSEFTTVYAGEQPAVAPASESRLPLSYERYLIRSTYDRQGLALQESGNVAGINGREGATLADLPDGTTLSALIAAADRHWPVDGGWTWCRARERVDPEFTVQRNAEVDLCWGQGGEEYFAALHRFADGTWDAWVKPSRTRVSHLRWEEPTELLTPAGVSYELALAAVFRAMGDHLPDGFGLNYLDRRITPGLPGPAQA